MDIFSKDFLLIPIHDALHWSLIIVCHPGLDFESSDRKPYILHLDSMEGVQLFIKCSSMQRSCSLDCMWFASIYCNCDLFLQLCAAVIAAQTRKKPIICLSHHLYHDVTCLLVWLSCSVRFTRPFGFCTAATCCKIVYHCLEPISWLTCLMQ